MKPQRQFIDTLNSLRYGQLHDELTNNLHELTKACSETGKVGELTLKIKLKPGKAGQMEIIDEIKTRLPEFERGSTILFTTPEGNLQREDPRQMKLEGLRSVDEATGEIKELKTGKEIMENTTENKQIIDLAVGMVSAQRIGEHGIPYSILPEGYMSNPLEEMLETPVRKRGKVTLNDAQSFINYFIKHSDLGSIYGQIDPPNFIAVLNDHKTTSPGWRDHVANYHCPLSKEWRIWTESNNRSMKQSEFAQFIEDNLLDIVDPPGADMLEISRSLEAKKKVNFASAIRLSNGQTELTYEEEIQGTAAKGKLNIPEQFSLGISVLYGTDLYRVNARLRYRISEGNLVMWYDLLRPHKVLESAVMDVWKEIEAKTEQTIFNGSPF